MFWQLCLKNDKQTDLHRVHNIISTTNIQFALKVRLKKNQFKTRRQFHYLHNSKLLVFKLVSFYLSISVSNKEVESDNKTEDRCQSTHSGIAIMKMC